MKSSLRLVPTPFALATRRLLLAALVLPMAPLAHAASDADTAAVIQELRARLDVMEAQLKAEHAAAAPAPAKGNEIKLGDTKLTWGGYIKADAIYSRFSEGELAQSTSRDFYVPGTIPVSNGSGRSFEALDFHAKESRLFVKTETAIDGHKLGTHVEFDFIVNQSTTANEIVTNAYTPGLRRAFLTYDNWLIGQEWTTFMNLAALPETLDFVAFPSDGTVFVRQPQVRYSNGGFAVSVENPETSLLPGGGGAVAGTGDGKLPDLIARYSLKFDGGSEVSLAGLLRQLKVNNAAVGATPAVEDSTTGAGLSLAGKFALGKDDIKFMLNAGQGIGRYLALGTSADAVLASGKLDAIDLYSGYIAYKHAWSPQWRSTITASYFSADNDAAKTGTAVTKQVSSFSANLLYSPVAKLTFGGEFRHANREIESGFDGDLDRVQVSAKYSF